MVEVIVFNPLVKINMASKNCSMKKHIRIILKITAIN